MLTSIFCVRRSRQFREGLEPTFQCFVSVASAIDIFHALKQQQNLTFFY